MRSIYTQAIRQTKTLNQAMILAVKVMQMSAVELHEFLSNTAERNPFVEIERYQHNTGTGKEKWAAMDDWEHVASSQHTRKSLFRHLADQFPMVIQSDHDMRIAFAFLQEIEPSGWLTTAVEQIAEINGFGLTECRNVLNQLQTLEPAGVFASDLKDCLRLQAIDRDQLDDVMEVLIAHLDQLLNGDVMTLARRLKIDPKEFAYRLEQIRRMEPKPGSPFSFDETLQRESDVVVNVTDHEMTLELNRSNFPSINLSLPSLVREQEKRAQQAALRELINEAKTVQTAVEMRKTTTLTVVAAIFERQRKFLTLGYRALRPMGMKDIADDIGVSEATVSRVISGLTIQCPHGCFDAKSLFCNPVAYCDQPQTKYVALQMIKNLIDNEDKKSPLSDQKIASLMQGSGLEVSRRTVTKYRQSLGLEARGIRRRAAEISGLAGHKKTPNNPGGQQVRAFAMIPIRSAQSKQSVRHTPANHIR